MHPSILDIADGFWNIRGSYKTAGILDIGTHASLVRRRSGKLVFLDSYTLSEAVKRDLDEVTRGGEDVEAILLSAIMTARGQSVKAASARPASFTAGR